MAHARRQLTWFWAPPPGGNVGTGQPGKTGPRTTGSFAKLAAARGRAHPTARVDRHREVQGGRRFRRFAMVGAMLGSKFLVAMGVFALATLGRHAAAFTHIVQKTETLAQIAER